MSFDSLSPSFFAQDFNFPSPGFNVLPPPHNEEANRDSAEDAHAVGVAALASLSQQMVDHQRAAGMNEEPAASNVLPPPMLDFDFTDLDAQFLSAHPAETANHDSVRRNAVEDTHAKRMLAITADLTSLTEAFMSLQQSVIEQKTLYKESLARTSTLFLQIEAHQTEIRKLDRELHEFKRTAIEEHRRSQQALDSSSKKETWNVSDFEKRLTNLEQTAARTAVLFFQVEAHQTEIRKLDRELNEFKRAAAIEERRRLQQALDNSSKKETWSASDFEKRLTNLEQTAAMTSALSLQIEAHQAEIRKLDEELNEFKRAAKAEERLRLQQALDSSSKKETWNASDFEKRLTNLEKAVASSSLAPSVGSELPQPLPGRAPFLAPQEGVPEPAAPLLHPDSIEQPYVPNANAMNVMFCQPLGLTPWGFGYPPVHFGPGVFQAPDVNIGTGATAAFAPQHASQHSALLATTEASVEHAPTADSPSRRPNERRDATPHHRKSRPKMMTDCLQSWRLRTDQPDVPPSRKRDFK